MSKIVENNVFDFLKKRGYAQQVSSETGVWHLLGESGATIYEGFDPSASSLHLGHLESLMIMHWLQEAGHRIIFILGGGTGKVGDPTGKTKMRKLLTPEQVLENGKKIIAQVEKIGLLRFHGENAALMVNNDDWISSANFMDGYLLPLAKHFSVNEMIKMRTFADRLKANENLSLLEFLYCTLQAWDFLVLFEKYNCRLQIGGSDQWANILQGIDLIRRKHGEEAFAFTFPLITTPGGKSKMGKTEKGVIWLDSNRTCPFDMYQYLISLPDPMVPQSLRLLTFLSLEEIDEVLAGHPRDAQHKLAFEVTKIIHGERETKKAQVDAQKLFGTRTGAVEALPTFKISDDGMEIGEILIRAGVLPSKSEIRRRIEQDSVKIDGQKIDDPRMLIKHGGIIRYGKRAFLKVIIS